MADSEQQENYSDGYVRRSIVYSRQDIVLLVSHLSSANRQLDTIKKLLTALVIIAAFMAVEILRR